VGEEYRSLRGLYEPEIRNQCLAAHNIIVTKDSTLILRLPNLIPFVIRVILVAGKVFTLNCDTGKLSALINVETLCRK
jgi:hypothetical protein